jgi:hypothetical protein
MSVGTVRGAAIALSFCISAATAWAQDAPRETGARGPLPGPNATPPGAESNSPTAGNTVQPVPGAMPGSDTVPSALSARNADADKLVTLAYTFKNLSDEERAAIYRALKDTSAASAPNADVGIELPAGVPLHDVPENVAARVPQTRGYQYTVADGRVLLVAPIYRVVVAALFSAPGAPVGQSPR